MNQACIDLTERLADLEADNHRLSAEVDEFRLAEGRLSVLASIVESAEDAIISKTLDGDILTWNPGAERLYQYTAEEVIGRNIAILIPPGLPNEILELLRRVARGERIEHYQATRAKKNGDRVDVSLTISAVKDKAGNIIGVSTIARDMTEQKKAEEKIRKLNEALMLRASESEAANKELEAFSYSVSHDLSAPLRCIDGFSKALVEDCGESLSPEAVEHLARIRAATQRMAQLIDDMLQLSRITRTEMRRIPVNLTSIARTIADDLCRCEPERCAEFLIAPDLTASGDPDLLRTVLQNLIHNSWKFTNRNASARIEVGTREADGERVFFVRDDGAGFDMRYVEKLFTAFQRLHAAEEFPGTGVGLASVQRVIRRHGGRVWAEGRIDEVATIYFTV